MIKFQLAEPLSFIHKSDLTMGYVEEQKGFYKITSGDFKQLIKKSQFDQLMAANIISKSGTPEKEEDQQQQEEIVEDDQGDDKTEENTSKKGAGTRRK